MAQEYISVLGFFRPDVSQGLSNQMHMGTDRPVRILSSTPMFSPVTASSMLQQIGPAILAVDAHVPGYALKDVLALKSGSKRPFALVGLANAGSSQMEEMIQCGRFDALYTLPVNDNMITKMCDELPGVYETVSAGWGKGVWDAATPDQIRDTMSNISGAGWQRAAIGVWSPKGGVGKTTLSVELAAALATIGGRNVALIDANMNGGHVRIRLNIESDYNLLSAATAYQMTRGHESMERDFPARLKDYLIPVSGAPNLVVLPGIQNMDQATHEDIKAERGMEFTTYLIRYLKRAYDFVIVDMGSSINVGVHRGVFASVDSIVVVGTPDLTGLVDIKNGVDSLVSAVGIDRSRFTLVLNMWQDSLGVSLAQAANLVKLTAVAAITQDPTGAVTKCGNEGISYVARFAGQKNNSETTESSLGGLVALASHFYPSIAAAWNGRLKTNQPDAKKGNGNGNGGEKKKAGLFGLGGRK
jgi:MinD-like ATPase involved in chromosome partitioning or flagellar assembly